MSHASRRAVALELLAAQDGKCAICSIRLTVESACIDHDHRTDLVRGALCQPCNVWIGHHGDSAESLTSYRRHVSDAVAYLSRPSLPYQYRNGSIRRLARPLDASSSTVRAVPWHRDESSSVDADRLDDFMDTLMDAW